VFAENEDNCGHELVPVILKVYEAMSKNSTPEVHRKLSLLMVCSLNVTAGADIF
jgi:hypothetical protein